MEKSHQKHPSVGFAVHNHAQNEKANLARASSQNTPMTINNFGNNNTTQIGSNVSNSGDNANSGNINVVSSTGKEEVARDLKGSSFWNSVFAIVVGLMCGWWLLPQSLAFGQVRTLVTVVFIVSAVTFAAIGWFQFRFANWEKLSYMGLGAILIVRASIPTVVGGLSGDFSLSQDSVLTNAIGYLGVSENPWTSSLNLLCGLILLAFAFCVKSSS